MNRRTLLFGFATLSLASLDLLASEEKKTCPICKSKLTEAGKVKFAKNSVDLNFILWFPESSLHGHYSPWYRENRPFCLNCSFTYISETNTWERSTIIKKSFYIPLVSSIQNFPLYEGIEDYPLYSQKFNGENADEGREEEISFWSNHGGEHKKEIERYCETSSIDCEFSSEKGNKFWVIAHKKIS
jgi:hypothetical protein